VLQAFDFCEKWIHWNACARILEVTHAYTHEQKVGQDKEYLMFKNIGDRLSSGDVMSYNLV